LFRVLGQYIDTDINIGEDNILEYIYVELFGRVDVPKKANVYGEIIGYNFDKITAELFALFSYEHYGTVFTFLEGIMQFLKNKDFTNTVNKVFEEELVQHRFIGNQVTDLTDVHEIEAVQSCIDYDDESRKHIEKATQLLCNREHPDYENSVKEAISAVEAKCSEILGKKASLGEALRKLEGNGLIIHPAMKDAFNKLFGYTSDTNGIRHGSGMDINTSKAEAKFMLVTCATFCNYLREYQ